MAKSDALKQTASEQATRKLSKQGSSQQIKTAADMFWGFYYMNTRARAAYCQRHGVNLSQFTTAFTSEHREELARAQAVYSRAGIDSERLLPKLMPALTSMVEQDMKDVAAGAQVPLDKACDLFNEKAQQLSRLIQLPAAVKHALMPEFSQRKEGKGIRDI